MPQHLLHFRSIFTIRISYMERKYNKQTKVRSMYCIDVRFDACMWICLRLNIRWTIQQHTFRDNTYLQFPTCMWHDERIQFCTSTYTHPHMHIQMCAHTKLVKNNMMNPLKLLISCHGSKCVTRNYVHQSGRYTDGLKVLKHCHRQN